MPPDPAKPSDEAEKLRAFLALQAFAFLMNRELDTLTPVFAEFIVELTPALVRRYPGLTRPAMGGDDAK